MADLKSFVNGCNRYTYAFLENNRPWNLVIEKDIPGNVTVTVQGNVVYKGDL